MRRNSAIAVLICAIAGLLAGPAVASAQGVGPDIIGGYRAVGNDGTAQIDWNDVSANGGYECSGTIIAPQWVLTARHCTNPGGIHVFVGSALLGGGTRGAVDQQFTSPNGDIALLHLTAPITSRYVRLATPTTVPAAGDTNYIEGWGRTSSNSAPAIVLKSADVQVTGLGQDVFGGQAIASRGLDGSAYYGDSGGPEFTNAGVEVGVCSTGANSGSDPHGTQLYALIANSRAWIQNLAGV